MLEATHDDCGGSTSDTRCSSAKKKTVMPIAVTLVKPAFKSWQGPPTHSPTHSAELPSTSNQLDQGTVKGVYLKGLTAQKADFSTEKRIAQCSGNSPPPRPWKVSSEPTRAQ